MSAIMRGGLQIIKVGAGVSEAEASSCPNLCTSLRVARGMKKDEDKKEDVSRSTEIRTAH
jgi:hypothetical protein